MTFVTVRDGCSFDERQSEVRGLPPKPGRLRAESRGSRSCQTAAADRRSAISRAISDCSALERTRVASGNRTVSSNSICERYIETR